VKSISEDLIVFSCNFITPISLYVHVTPNSGGQAVWTTYFFCSLHLIYIYHIQDSFCEMQSMSPFKSFLNVQYSIVYCQGVGYSYTEIVILLYSNFCNLLCVYLVAGSKLGINSCIVWNETFHQVYTVEIGFGITLITSLFIFSNLCMWNS
jgi:hypothetical protein